MEGCPWVEASPSPGFAPATCIKMKRRARPAEALCLLPGPNAPNPLAKPGTPCVMSKGATGCVVAFTPLRLNSGRAKALTAAASTSKCSGRHPAITAFTAMMRRVASPRRGSKAAMTSSGFATPSSMASTLSGVGGMIGSPSPQPRSASSSMMSLGSAEASSRNSEALRSAIEN